MRRHCPCDAQICRPTYDTPRAIRGSFRAFISSSGYLRAEDHSRACLLRWAEPRGQACVRYLRVQRGLLMSLHGESVYVAEPAPPGPQAPLP